MESIVKRLMENRRLSESYIIYRVLGKESNSNYNKCAYLLKNEKGRKVFKYNSALATNAMIKFTYEKAKEEVLRYNSKDDGYVYNMMKI